MKQNDLRRLRRTDLLELLLELSRENDNLRKENQELRQQLEDRTISIEKAGSLAEASLQLNGIFEAAQNACEQYLQNIQARSQNMEEHCRQMEQRTQEKCNLMISNARDQVRFYMELSKLPVMSSWDRARLRIAPCRYYGSVNGEDLVIMAHNYKNHFGRIKNLKAGDLVIFTDMDGVATCYEVISQDILPPDAVEEMTAGVFDLTLFTCTYGGENRISVYCDIV